MLKKIRKEKYPKVIMGDMNDVCGFSSLNAPESAGFKDALVERKPWI